MGLFDNVWSFRLNANIGLSPCSLYLSIYGCINQSSRDSLAIYVLRKISPAYYTVSYIIQHLEGPCSLSLIAFPIRFELACFCTHNVYATTRPSGWNYSREDDRDSQPTILDIIPSTFFHPTKDIFLLRPNDFSIDTASDCLAKEN